MPVPDDLTEFEREVRGKLIDVRRKAEAEIAAAEQEAVAVLYTANLGVNRMAAVLGVGKRTIYARVDEGKVSRRQKSKYSPVNSGMHGEPDVTG